MKQFLDLASVFRLTPIVDDDFPRLRNQFDKELSYMIATMPKVVCLCGSTRFMEAFQKANLNETLKGNIVLSIGCNTKSDVELFSAQNRDAEFEETKRKLDELHKRKIDLADEVFVLNVNGYIGESTRSEIEYAEAHNKPVRYLEPLSKSEIA